MNIVIYGAGGYIGNVLCRRYLDLGHNVLGVDNFYKGQCDALLSIIGNPRFSFMYGSITKIEDCQKALTYFDTVDRIVNLGGVVGFPACNKDPDMSKAVNVLGAENVVIARNNIYPNTPVFFASTGSVYGKLDEICTESSPTNPLSVYGKDKLEGEKRVLSHPNTLAYRFATCFGPSANMRINLLINDLVFQAMTNHCLTIFEAEAKRTFIFIDDFCKSIIFGLDNIESLRYNLYNCGNNTLNYTKREIAEAIATKTGCYVHYADVGKDPDLRDYSVDYSRITDEGFVCDTGLNQGIDAVMKAVPLLRIRHNYE